MTRFTYIFAALLLTAAPALAQPYSYAPQAYDAQGHVLRLPAGYQQPVTYPAATTYQRVETSPGYAVPVSNSMYPASSDQATAASTQQSTTVTTTTTTTAAARPAIEPLTVESDTTRSFAPMAARVASDNSINVMMKAACDDDGNHRAHNKGINTSTTVSGSCLD